MDAGAKGYTSEEFADLLLDKCAVAVGAGNWFGKSGEGFVRIGLLIDEPRFTEACERIGSWGYLSRVQNSALMPQYKIKTRIQRFCWVLVFDLQRGMLSGTFRLGKDANVINYTDTFGWIRVFDLYRGMPSAHV